MITDQLNYFVDNLAVTATAATLGDVIDLGDDVTLRNIGGKQAIFFVVETGTALADTGNDATLTVDLVSDSTANLSTSPTVHISTGAIPFASLGANRMLYAAPLPFGQYERYLGVRTTVANGPFTGGTLRAFLTLDPQFWTVLGSNNPSAK